MIRSFLAFAFLVPIGFAIAEQTSGKKDLLLIAGKPSHGYGAHEHFAGLKVLEQAVNDSTDQFSIQVVRGWPQDDSLIEAADSIVIYCDGGARHLAIPHLDRLRSKLADGCGLVCLHYAVEMVPGEPGDAWVDMLGGHFEIDWSVNPHWVGNFESLPEHPITRGVEPFATNDEWYFHLRFKDSNDIVPILAAVAPPETMRRKDGHHSGNPAARKSVAAGEKQTVAWAYQRPDGGRSFGFTGGHFHWNWGQSDMRRLVTNAIRWSAGGAVPEAGSSLGEVAVDDLLVNQDYDKPAKFDLDKVIEEFQLLSGAKTP